MKGAVKPNSYPIRDDNNTRIADDSDKTVVFSRKFAKVMYNEAKQQLN